MTQPGPQLDFSVIIPCRNEARTLGACLEGLRGQDFPARRFEVILVDGGSTDGSRDLAHTGGVRVLRDGAKGPSSARNVGIRAARASIVVFMDADCVPRFDWLSRYDEVFRERPDLAGVSGGLRLPRATLRGRLEDNDARTVYRGFITSNVAYRKEALLAVGGFAEDLVCAEDYDLAWRVMDAGRRVVHDPRPIVTHFPPELGGSPLRYLRKQFWYARHDVPTLVRAAQRARRATGDAPASLLLVMRGAATLPDALGAAMACGGLLARAPLGIALGVATVGLSASRRVLRAARAVGEPARAVPALMGLATLKGLARGSGTLAGIVDIARPSRRRLVRSRGAASPVLSAGRSPSTPWEGRPSG